MLDGMKTQEFRVSDQRLVDQVPPDEVMTLIDRRIGARIRERRIGLGLSQQQLGAMVGVSTQQQHKYEHGVNRITAGRLWIFAQTLQVSASWLFGENVQTTPAIAAYPIERSASEITNAFEAIEDTVDRDVVLRIARALRSRP